MILGPFKEDQRAKTLTVSVAGDRGFYSLQAVGVPKNHSFLRYKAIRFALVMSQGQNYHSFTMEKDNKLFLEEN